MKIKSQDGFSLIEGLLSIIAVALIAFVGYYVYSNQTKASDTLDTAQAATANPAPPKHKYLEIKELGIKLPLNSKLDGLKYTMAPTDDSIAGLTTNKFEQAVADCQSADTASGSFRAIGSVTKVSGKYDSNAEPQNFFAEFSKQFSGFYLTYGTADGGASLLCSDKTPAKVKAVETIFSAVSPALKEATKNAVLIQ